MAKAKKVNDDREKIAKNVQKQYENLFSGQDAPPAPINIRQMEELKARVAELESKLKQQESSSSGLPATAALEIPLEPEPVAKPIEANLVNRRKPIAMENGPKLIGQWAGAIFAVFSLVLLALSIYMVYIVGKGQPDLSDKTLEPVAFLMIVASLISFFLIQRNRLKLGAWLLLSIVLIPPLPAVLVLRDIFAVMILYIAFLAPILIAWVLPKTSSQRAIIATGMSILGIIGIQAWNPAFRLGSSNLPSFTIYLIILAVLAIGVFAIREFLNLSLRPKVIMALVGITALTVAVISYYLLNQIYQNAYNTTATQITTENREHVLSI